MSLSAGLCKDLLNARKATRVLSFVLAQVLLERVLVDGEVGLGPVQARDVDSLDRARVRAGEETHGAPVERALEAEDGDC